MLRLLYPFHKKLGGPQRCYRCSSEGKISASVRTQTLLIQLLQVHGIAYNKSLFRLHDELSYFFSLVTHMYLFYTIILHYIKVYGRIHVFPQPNIIQQNNHVAKHTIHCKI
jgi:hypothetical protein